MTSLQYANGKTRHRDIPTVDAPIRDYINAIPMSDNGRCNVIDANLTPRRQPTRNFSITLGYAEIVFVAVNIGRQQTRHTEIGYTGCKIIANELEQVSPGRRASEEGRSPELSCSTRPEEVVVLVNK
jgi:hypothetical protein